MEPAEAGVYVGHLLGGRYRVEECRGRGQFSGVFLARDESNDRPVAVKILSGFTSDAAAIMEFGTEQELLEGLISCSHIVDILDAGEEEIAATVTLGEGSSPVEMPIKVRYLVLERADGSLEELLLTRAQIEWLDRLRIFRDVVKATHQMHIGKKVHRDIKSDNTLLFEAAGAFVAKLADLGRSRDTSRPQRFVAESYEAGRGDLRFAPPELLWMCGGEDAIGFLRADLYLLGSIFFELATAVGLTAFVFGDYNRVLAHARQFASQAERAADFNANVSELREQYELALEVLKLELPPPVRGLGIDLLRRLGDPDPARRGPVFRLERQMAAQWDLQWVLRRIDIMMKVLEHEEHKRPKWATPRKARRR